MGLDFEIQYRPWQDNKATDALSRQMSLVALSVVHTSLCKQIDEEVQQDAVLSQLIQELHQNPGSHKGYSCLRGRLYYEGKVVLRKGSVLLPCSLLNFIVLHREAIRAFQKFQEGCWCGILARYKERYQVICSQL